MPNNFQFAVNTSIYDGHDLEVAFASIARCGYNKFELAYNQGYVGNLDPQLFSQQNADYVNQLKDKYQLTTVALGCTMDLGSSEMVEAFKTRIQFANKIGAKFLNACTTNIDKLPTLINNLKQIAPIAADNGCVICLENGGDYDYNAFTSVADGIAILDSVDHPAVAINFDPGNTVTYAAQLGCVDQALLALPYCQYFHIKDVKIINGEFYFPVIGEGEIDFKTIIQQLVAQQIPASFEIPLRMHRLPDSKPIRGEQKVDLSRIEQVLIKSRQNVATFLV